MDLTDHFRLIWRRRWLILGASVLVAAAVYVWSSRRPDVYSSSAEVDVLAEAESGSVINQDQLQVLVGRHIALTKTSSVLSDAIGRTELDVTIPDARGLVSAAESESTSGLLTITAEGASPAEAQSLAQGVTQALRAAAAERGNVIEVVTRADLPSAPISPDPTRDAVLAFLIAFVLNAEAAALVGALRGRLDRGHEAETVERLTDATVLGLIPRRQKWLGEAFRKLRSEFELVRVEPPTSSVAVIGADPGNGASFVAFGLAQATANLKLGVVLVDANLRRPVLAGELRLPDQPGLVDFIREGTVGWADLPQANPLQSRFRVVPAGEEAADPSALLGGGALRKVIHQLDDSELVIVDTPSINESADALVIASQCDAAILVIDAARTRRRTVAEAVLRIQQAHVRLLGVVINRVDPDDRTRPPREYRRPHTLIS